MRAGIIAAVIANANRGKNTIAFTPKDFMPYAKMEEDRQRMLSHPKGRALGKKVRGILAGIAKQQKR